MTVTKTQEKKNIKTLVPESELPTRKLDWVPIKDCVVDATYQRDLCESWVNKLIASWEPNKCEPLKAAKRGSKYYIFDGSHRLEAMRRKKYKSVPCWVYTDVSRESEIDMFVSQVSATKRLKPVDTFKANLCINDPVDVMVKSVLDKYGFKASTYGGINHFRPLTDARTTVRRLGYDMLNTIFEVYEKSGWHKTSGQTGFKAAHFRIIRQLLIDNIDRKDDIIELLKTQYPDVITFRAAAYANCKSDVSDESQACRLYAESIKKVK